MHRETRRSASSDGRSQCARRERRAARLELLLRGWRGQECRICVSEARITAGWCRSIFQSGISQTGLMRWSSNGDGGCDGWWGK